MSRPIERIAPRRMSNEPKELMNCKSCRKRKVKCNRIKPKCESCQIFECECIYDAAPKKRGPKTDVLESLVKRVKGLEQIMKDERHYNLARVNTSAGKEPADLTNDKLTTTTTHPPSINVVPETPPHSQDIRPSHHGYESFNGIVDTYFSRLHCKPYYILDETATRARLSNGRLPHFTLHAICAVTLGQIDGCTEGDAGVNEPARDYAMRSRAAIEVDNPSIDNLQALLLLVVAHLRFGQGEKSYMLLSTAISMAFALELHRELPAALPVPPIELELRRKLFWTCYIIDRLVTTGSRRPHLISDDTVTLRLPATMPGKAGELRLCGNGQVPTSHSPHFGMSSPERNSYGSLIEVSRILGIADRYLVSGGMKVDSHFPWNPVSQLSKIRGQLDHWAATTQEMFLAPEALIRHQYASILTMSKLIYHLVHCLVYRPLLPLNVSEVMSSSMHHSWQIEAIDHTLSHAHAIVDLIEHAKSTIVLDYPSFAAHCICTAGTVLVHGAHYDKLQIGLAIDYSSEYLSRAVSQLEQLLSAWSCAEHCLDVLKTVLIAHDVMTKAVAGGKFRLASVFQLKNFFDRYPAYNIDGAHVFLPDATPYRTHFSNVAVETVNLLANLNSIPKDRATSQSSFSHYYPAKNVLDSQMHSENSVILSPERFETETQVETRFYGSMAISQRGLVLNNDITLIEDTQKRTGHHSDNFDYSRFPALALPHADDLGQFSPTTCGNLDAHDPRHDSLFDEDRAPDHDPFFNLLDALATDSGIDRNTLGDLGSVFSEFG